MNFIFYIKENIAKYIKSYIMYPYILCFCGRSIGDLYDLFKIMRIEKIAEAYAESDIDIDPLMINITDAIPVNLGDVFDDLNIHMDCCRARMLSQIEFKELY